MIERGGWLAATVVACTLLAGCGGGDEEEGAAASSTVPPTTQPSGASTSAPTTPPTTVAPTAATTTAPPTAPPSTAATTTVPALMPELVGMQLDAARSMLAAYNVRITVENRIAPNPAGTVVEQTPSSGAPFPTSVTLVVSVAPPPVPAVTGLDVGTARQRLAELGFEVVESRFLDEASPEGTVLSQDPVEGTENAGTVNLVIAQRPVVVALTDLESVANSGVGGGTYDANATSYPDSLAAYNGSIEYNLSRAYRRLDFDIGVNDEDASNAVMLVTVTGDNRLLDERQVAFGTTEQLQIDVTGILRLRIDIARVSGDSARLVIGTPRLYGLPGEVPTD